MTEQINEKYADVSLRDIDELKAIYEDYLYTVRQHELLLQRESMADISFRQVHSMYPECKDPRLFSIPWYTEKLDINEQKEFKDYVENNIRGDGKKTYVSLQHVKEDDNNFKGPLFVMEPYTNLGRTSLFPSMIEEYTLSHPKEATFGNTEFYIDGHYKAIYLGDKYKDRLIADCKSDEALLTEITVMIKLGECFRQNGYVDDDKFGRMAINVYAEEVLEINENNLLEMLGIFVEKVRDICHAKYQKNNSRHDIRRAQNDRFLNLPDSFQDYVNIRNFMRHQWDTLDDLDDFSLSKSAENKRVRAERVNSYLKFCDKTAYQRMVSFVEALHQMQKIISEVDPHWLIREKGESNSKFAERVKAVCQQYLEEQINVEINYSLADKKYEVLNRILHKDKLFPNVRIVDDFSGDNDKFECMEDYKRRSLFLRNFHDIESYVMGYCQRRGQDKNNRGAWLYLQENGIIGAEECRKWQDYTTLRNDLAHNYFDENLRKRLRAAEEPYVHDFQEMVKKVYEAGPDVKKIRDDVFEYKYVDGEVVTVDYVSHNREKTRCEKESRKETKILEKKDNLNKNTECEAYDNGIEFKINENEIVSVTFPNKVSVNMNNQSINWGNRTYWYFNSENFNALQTARSTVRTDKELKVTSIFEEMRPISFRRGDSLMLDYRHRLVLDEKGRIKEFNYKNAENKIIKTRFKHMAGNRSDLVSFVDGTNILFSEGDVRIIHNNEVLSFDNRKQFVQTYNDMSSCLPQNTKQGYDL